MLEISDELRADVRKALYLLEDLGSPRAIADHLGQMGIKGRKHPLNCPITNYLKTTVDIPGGVTVSTHCEWNVRVPVGVMVGYSGPDSIFVGEFDSVSGSTNVLKFIMAHDEANAWGLLSDDEDGN